MPEGLAESRRSASANRQFGLSLAFVVDDVFAYVGGSNRARGWGHAVLGILVCARSMRRGSRRYARSRQCYRNFAAQGINVHGVAMIETTSLAGAGIGIERECIIIRLSYLPFLPSQWKRKPRA